MKSEIKEEVTEQATTEDAEKRVKCIFCVVVDWCLWRRARLKVINASNFRSGSLGSSLGHSIALFVFSFEPFSQAILNFRIGRFAYELFRQRPVH